MGQIRTADASLRWLLPARCLVGRSRRCHVRVEALETSSEHALLRWRGGGWEVQDLYSRNGTYVDGRLIEPGRSVALQAGARLGFGQPETFVLTDAGSPRPHAVGVGPPFVTLEMNEGVLALPDARQPEVTLYERDQQWWRRGADGEHPVADEEVVVTSGGAWWIHLPDAVPPTRDAANGPLRLAALSLRFGVHARDGGDEVIELDVLCGERRVELKTRAHHAPLLALARARLADHDRPLADQGWVAQDDLVRRLGCALSRLHVDVYRIRQQFAAAGVQGAVDIVERRPDRSLRIGVTDIEIEAIPRTGEPLSAGEDP
jgi:hypothetical protein